MGAKTRVRRAYLLSVSFFGHPFFFLRTGIYTACFFELRIVLHRVIHNSEISQNRRKISVLQKIHGFTKYEEPVNFNDYLDFKTDVLFSDSAAFIHSKKPFDFSCSQIYPQKDKLST